MKSRFTPDPCRPEAASDVNEPPILLNVKRGTFVPKKEQDTQNMRTLASIIIGRHNQTDLPVLH
jgi:hypothetical protein